MNQKLAKQVYAYGAAVAFQKLGFNVQQAQTRGVKLAEEEEIPWNVTDPWDVYEDAPEDLKDRAFRQSAVGGTRGARRGLLLGGGGGAALGALAGGLLGPSGDRAVASLIGGLAGGQLGMFGGGITGSIRGSRSGYRDALAGVKSDNLW